MGLVILGISLELLGFSLGYIEIKHKWIGDRLEDAIDNSEDWFRHIAEKNRHTIWFQALISLAIFFVLTMGIHYILSQYTHSVDDIDRILGDLVGGSIPFYSWIVFWIIVGSTGIVIVIFAMGDIIDALNKFSGGKAVGTIGVIIGVISIIVETVGLISL